VFAARKQRASVAQRSVIFGDYFLLDFGRIRGF